MRSPTEGCPARRSPWQAAPRARWTPALWGCERCASYSRATVWFTASCGSRFTAYPDTVTWDTHQHRPWNMEYTPCNIAYTPYNTEYTPETEYTSTLETTSNTKVDTSPINIFEFIWCLLSINRNVLPGEKDASCFLYSSVNATRNHFIVTWLSGERALTVKFGSVWSADSSVRVSVSYTEVTWTRVSILLSVHIADRHTDRPSRLPSLKQRK